MQKIYFFIVIMLHASIYGQDKDTETHTMDHGSNEIEWRIYDTDGPALTFALSSNQLWFSNGTVVGIYNLQSNLKKIYPKIGTFPSAGISSISAEKNGTLWFGGKNGVIKYAHSKAETFTKSNGLSDNTVNAILCHLGIVWIGTNNGISQFSGNAWKVLTTAQGICGNSIRGITHDNQGTVYFATNNGVAVFKGNNWTKFDRSSGTSSNDIKAISYDPRQKVLWIALGEMDVDNYNGKAWNTFMDIQSDITCIMADTQSRIWFGSQSGIIKYNGFEWVTDPKKVGFPATQVNHMYKDNKGDLFFAMESGVLHMKNPYPY